MRHALLLGSVSLDVDNVTNLVVDEVGRHGWHTGLTEVLLEHVARARADTERVRHGGLKSYEEERDEPRENQQNVTKRTAIAKTVSEKTPAKELRVPEDAGNLRSTSSRTSISPERQGPPVHAYVADVVLLQKRSPDTVR